MLRLLTTRARRRAGYWLALGYLVGLILTPLSVAFGDPAAAAHCLLDEFHMVAPVSTPDGHHAAMMHDHAGMMHDHAMVADGTHRHGTPTPPADNHHKTLPATCCCLFCVTAAASAAVSFAATPAPLVGALAPARELARGGLDPQRIDRPPILVRPV